MTTTAAAPPIEETRPEIVRSKPPGVAVVPTLMMLAFFFFFLLRFTLNAEGGHRTSLEALIRNLLPTPLANAVRVGRDPIKRFVDFLEQFLLALFQPQLEVRIDFGGGLIAQVWKGGEFWTIRQRSARFLKQFYSLLIKILADLIIFPSRLGRFFTRWLAERLAGGPLR